MSCVLHYLRKADVCTTFIVSLQLDHGCSTPSAGQILNEFYVQDQTILLLSLSCLRKDTTSHLMFPRIKLEEAILYFTGLLHQDIIILSYKILQRYKFNTLQRYNFNILQEYGFNNYPEHLIFMDPTSSE
jgi:hypothetical protein